MKLLNFLRQRFTSKQETDITPDISQEADDLKNQIHTESRKTVVKAQHLNDLIKTFGSYAVYNEVGRRKRSHA